jgi:predicted acetyltransferase
MKTLLTKDNKKVLIREIASDDAESSIRFSKQIFGLPTVLTTLNEFNQTVESQTKWIESFDKSQTKFALVAIHNEEVVGLLDFSTSNLERLKHGGAFGVSVLPEFQNNGIARAMIQLLLE